MVAPTWQFVVLVTLFGLSLLVHVVYHLLVAFLKHMGQPVPEPEAKPMTKSVHAARLVIFGFMMYLTYTLFAWDRNWLSLAIIVLHWSTLIQAFIRGFTHPKIGKPTLKKDIFNIGYCFIMLGLVLYYGATCL